MTTPASTAAGPTRRTRRRRLAAVLAALAVGVTPLAAAGTASASDQRSWPKPGPVKLDLLAINDFHGNLEPPSGSSGRVTDAGATVEAGGAAFLATHLDDLRSQARKRGAQTLTVAAGDLIGASPLLSAAFHDEPTIEALNLLELDVAAVGNHEFDEGYAELLRMQFGGCLEDGDGAQGQNSCPESGRTFKGADFQYLAANVRYAGKKRTVFPGYTVRRVGGIKVGFIGMTLENTPNIVTKAGVEGLTFHDEVETANALVPTLRRQGVKSIVVLLHEGATPNPVTQIDGCAGISGPGLDIAQRLHPEIDVVVSGHTHQPYICTVKDPAGKNRLLTSAFSFGRVVTDISLEIDRRTRDVIRPAAKADNTIATRTVTPHRGVVDLIARYTALVAPIRDAVIGRLAASSSITRTEDADGRDTALGNLIADAQRSDPSVVPAGGEAPVIAFMNPGGIRADLVAEADGDVTYGAAFTVQPFNNYVVSITLTGQQVLDVLNEQWNGTNEAANRVLQVSGLSYTWNRTQAGQAGADAVVAGSVLVDLDRNGTPETSLDPAASYRVVVNSFLADGGDGFTTLAEGSDRYFGGLDIDSLASYLTANNPYTATPTDRISAVD